MRGDVELSSLRCLLAAVDVVVGEGAVEGEVGLQSLDDCGQIGVGGGVELEGAVDDEPADVVRAGLFEGLLRGVRIGRGIEEEDRELGRAAGGEVEGVFAGEEEDAVAGGDFGVGDAD